MDFLMQERNTDVENQLLKSEEEILEKMRAKKYFKYKNDLKNFKYDEKKQCKNYPSMFSKKKKELSGFEKILTSHDDKSAIISLVLRKFENEDFLRKTIDLKRVMEKHESSEAHLMNLFSLLMFDWHDQSTHKRGYNLMQKFLAYKEVCPPSKSLFDKLFQILESNDSKVYHTLCLKIIFHYFEELKDIREKRRSEREENKTKKKLNDLKELDKQLNKETKDIQELTWKVIRMNNSEYKSQILTIFYAYLPNTKDDEYKNITKHILDLVKYDFEYSSVCKISYTSITKHCDEKFFNLLHLLKENLVAKFKLNFEEFIKINQKLYGEYWIHAIKTNIRVLYEIARVQGLVETQEFMLINTPNINIKAPVTSLFTELSEFQAVFNEPLDADDELILVNIQKYLDEFITIAPGSESINTINIKKLARNTPKIRKLLFGRKNLSSESFFEKFWSMKIINDQFDEDSSNEKMEKYEEFLNYIWNEFRLWEKPEILTMVRS